MGRVYESHLVDEETEAQSVKRLAKVLQQSRFILLQSPPSDPGPQCPHSAAHTWTEAVSSLMKV